MVRAFLCALVVVCGVTTPSISMAQGRSSLQVSVSPQPLRSAVLDFGLQAGVSIDAAGTERCGPTRGVRGRLSVDAALSRLMLGTHCVATRVGDGAYRIVRVAASPPVVARTIAAPPTPVTPTTLDEVVVTASRTDNLLLSRAPYGLSSLDGVTLERAGVSDLDGVAPSSPWA